MIARRMVFALLALGVLPAPAFADEPYLFDLLKQPAYRSAWDTMFKGQKIDPWIVTFGKTMNGVSSPGTPVTVDGQKDLIGWVCKPHDCGDNQLWVLFAPAGAQAWGLVMSGQKQRWLGDPSSGAKAALTKASQQ